MNMVEKLIALFGHAIVDAIVIIIKNQKQK